MKEIITIVLSVLITNSNAQTTTIFNEVLNSSGLAIEGDHLYIGALFENSIYKLDWTEADPTATVLVDNVDKPNGIAIHGDYLYASLNSNNQAADKVIRIDITKPNPVVENYVTLPNPNGIVFRNYEMYVNAGKSIFFIDTDSDNPTPIEIINDMDFSVFGTIGLCIVDNYLFMPANGGIAKYNIDLPNPTMELIPVDIGYIQGITNFTDEKILFVSYGPDMVYTLDIFSGTYTPLFPTNLITPNDIIYNSDDLIFVSNLEGGEVNKINVGMVSTEDFDNQSLSIFPNPASDFINIQDSRERHQAAIFNVLGQKVYDSKMESDAMIDIRNLSKGIYYLKIDNKHLTKFIKQ